MVTSSSPSPTPSPPLLRWFDPLSSDGHPRCPHRRRRYRLFRPLLPDISYDSYFVFDLRWCHLDVGAWFSDQVHRGVPVNKGFDEGGLGIGSDVCRADLIFHIYPSDVLEMLMPGS